MKWLLLFSLLLVSPARADWKFGSGTPAEKAKVEKAIAFLRETPTGRSVLEAVRAAHEFSIEVGTDSDNGSYDDEYKVLSLNRKAVAAWPDWKLARLLCHELTHAVQDSLGINRASYDFFSAASGVSEFAALSMEVRFWVEAGAPVDTVRDFNALRMWAYLSFPETVRVGWVFTNDSQKFKEPIEDKLLAGYWASVLESESAWRARWAGRFPAFTAREAVAFEYLENRVKKPVAKWLPSYLERPEGPVPAGASALDRQLIGLHRLVK